MHTLLPAGKVLSAARPGLCGAINGPALALRDGETDAEPKTATRP